MVLDIKGSLYNPSPYPEDAEAFYRTIGEFHHAFSSMEHQLARIVRIVLTKDLRDPYPSVVIAALSSMRMAPLKDTIKRLTKATKASAQRTALIADVLKHLGDIQFLRDRITHHLTHQSPDNREIWVNNNFVTVKEFGQEEELSFSLSLIGNATIDLWVAMDISGKFFDHFLLPHKMNPLNAPEWRYKPVQLTRGRRK